MPENKKTTKKTFSKEEDLQRVLTSMKRRSEEEDTYQRANQLGYPYIDLGIYPIDQENLKIVPQKEAQAGELAVIGRKEKELKIACFNPQLEKTKEIIRKLEEKEGYGVKIFVASRSSLERAWSQYEKVKLVEVFDFMRMNLKGEDLLDFEKDLKDLIDLERRIKEIPVTEVLNIVIAGAIKMDASDIHFEPLRDDKIRLRYRIDGVLQTVAELPMQAYPMILSRVKMLSQMVLNVRNTAQDGRFSIKFEDGSEMDIRASVLPGNFGEYIVLRLLNQKMENLKLENLGLEGLSLEIVQEEAEKKQGMIINSGPTGSGKTTTLYSIINKLNTPDKKIITIEDPIEYQIKGINQTQVDKKGHYTFATGLRSIVRQDPDIVLVGEIRDEETTEIAIHAALTGHLVLTSIHANSAAGVIPRLIDLGAKPGLVAPAVNVLIAQRLLRKLCPHCKEKYEPASETIELIRKILSIISPKAKVEIPQEIKYLWRSRGCAKCHGLGFKGRVGVFEVLRIDDDIRDLVEKLAPEWKILNTALENGMITVEQDGILKAIEGITSLEEVHRVLGKGDYLVDLYERLVNQFLAQGLSVKKDALEEAKKIIAQRSKMETIFEEAPIKKRILFIFAMAILMRASDIHLEPGEKEMKVRFRIDGVLQDIIKLSMENFLPLLNEIKNFAGFKTESQQGVLDGRFKIRIEDETEKLEGKEVDIRVSIIKGGFGEVAVLRLLSQLKKVSTIDDLEISPLNLKLIKKEAQKPNGLIAITGPTGSGKTTTLYGIINHINTPEKKIITVEDPIEYQVDGVMQTQVNTKEKYTFSTALRSLLRQNPDVMMVGEIRDNETAKIAYQAALTGHLVLATLHTNDAAGSLQRLLSMGVELSNIAAGTNCFVAQRLVRKICPFCKKEKYPTEEEKNSISQIIGGISPVLKKEFKREIDLVQKGNFKIFESEGCKECNFIGFKGRFPIAEVLVVDGEMEKFINQAPTTRDFYQKAIEKGMLSMAQDGIIRVLQGETAFNEIARITREISEN